MLNILAVGAGGFLGSVCRYLINLIKINETTLFPLKTFGINIVGCIVIGIIAVLASKNAEVNPYVLLFLKVGLCGGFTTFSTFALETSDLIKTGHIVVAFLYAALSVLAGVAVIFMVEYMTVKFLR